MPEPEVTGATITVNDQQPPHGQETTADDKNKNDAAANEAELSKEDQRAIIEVVRKYKQSWFLRRRMIVKRVLKAYEFFKGNQFISFDPETFQWFDALDASFQGGANGQDGQDVNLYQFATNFYQMLGFAFIAALSSQLPKTRFMPESAEDEQDIATAKASSRIQEVIERQNQIMSLHKQGLLFLWMAGCYFRHTRYVIDRERAGTHTEPVLSMELTTVIPAYYLCRGCSTNVSEDAVAQSGGLNCPNCEQPLSENDYYPPEEMSVPVFNKTKDVPNGIVAMDLYSPLHVDAAPYAKSLSETPILNVDEEVDIAAIRESYPEQWDALKSSIGPMLTEAGNERQARQIVYSEQGGRSNIIQDDMPTLSRTWIQPWAFNSLEDQIQAKKLKKMFPKGCLLVNVGDTFLEARCARLEDQWSWAGSIQKTFGLFPPAVGDASIPIQECINDVAVGTHDYMDMLSFGITLYNSELIDGEALNGKPMRPATFNPIKLKRAAMPGNTLEEAIVNIKAEADAQRYTYQEKLVYTMQLISGTPPQIFGGSGDKHIETMGGQQQQLSTAMGKLILFWDNIRDEYAKAAELAVRCGAENYTDRLTSVITGEDGEFRNEYVDLEEMQGSVHAYPETDQNYPMSHADIQQWWNDLIKEGGSGKNPFINAIMDEPGNQEQVAIWTGVPDLVVPGRDMRTKVLRVIDLLMKSQTIQKTIDADASGNPLPQPTQKEFPSLEPDPEIDDMEVVIKATKQWLQKNFIKADTEPKGYANVKAYLKIAKQYAEDDAKRQAMMQAAAQGPGKQPPSQGEPAQ